MTIGKPRRKNCTTPPDHCIGILRCDTVWSGGSGAGIHPNFIPSQTPLGFELMGWIPHWLVEVEVEGPPGWGLGPPKGTFSRPPKRPTSHLSFKGVLAMPLKLDATKSLINIFQLKSEVCPKDEAEAGTLYSTLLKWSPPCLIGRQGNPIFPKW